MISRCRAMPCSLARLDAVTLSDCVTMPRTPMIPTSRITEATRTSMIVKPSSRRAGARHDARGATGDDEVVARLRVRGDRVPAGRRRPVHVDLTLRGAEVQARLAQSGVATLGVVLRIGKARLDMRDEVASIRL